MRPTTATLRAAFETLSGKPALSLRVEDRPPLADRLTWEEITTTGAAARGSHHCAPFANGWLARIQNDASGNVHACVDHMDGSAPTWYQIGTQACPTGDSVAIVTLGAEVWCLWLDAQNPRKLKARHASNYLSSWGQTSTVYESPSGSVLKALAAAYCTNGDPPTNFVYVILCADYGGPDPDDRLISVFEWQGSWYYGSTHGTPLGGVTSLDFAVVPGTNEAYVLVSTYLAAEGGSLKACSFDSYSAAWGSFATLIPPAPNSGMEYRSVSLVYSPAGDAKRWLVGRNEYYSCPVADERPTYYWTTSPLHPGLPIPHPCDSYPSQWGMAFAKTAAYYYVLGTDKGYRAPTYSLLKNGCSAALLLTYILSLD